MTRLKLDVGTLEVQSFVVAESGSMRGTVRAHSAPYETWETSCTQGAYLCTGPNNTAVDVCVSRDMACPNEPVKPLTSDGVIVD